VCSSSSANLTLTLEYLTRSLPLVTSLAILLWCLLAPIGIGGKNNYAFMHYFYSVLQKKKPRNNYIILILWCVELMTLKIGYVTRNGSVLNNFVLS
jgi:hypothetical protein